MPANDTAETLDRAPEARGPVDPKFDADTPRRIGRYVVRGTLGSGGMGVVFDGYDEQLGRRVAIKRLNFLGGRLAFSRSVREAQALARLSHPNVVGVHEVIEAKGRFYIVMEFVAGRTLRTWLAERKPNLAELLAALAQAGHGVAAAHEAGLVHRDFKPENIMIGDDGRVRVMDFGLARSTEPTAADTDVDMDLASVTNMLAIAVTVTGAQLGTPGYMAPEQYLGRLADARSDIFSFCVVLFEALHRRRPFVGVDPTAVREATLRGKIGPLAAADDVPAWLEAVVRRGLAVDPEARWPSMKTLLAALADDPLARRRRLARTVGVVTLAGTLAAVLSFIYVARAQERALARAEELASARLAAAQKELAGAEPATAEAIFRAFVSDPSHRGTRALARAWQLRGDQRRDDPAVAQAAYAEAYVHTQQPGDSAEVLRSMSEVFHETWEGPGLASTLALLRAHAGDGPELADLALDAALWQRDLAAADAALATPDHPRAAWRPMLAHLATARLTGLPTTEVMLLPPGGPARVVVRSGDGHDLSLLDGALAEVGRWRSGDDIRLIPRSTWVTTYHVGETAIIDLLSPGTALWRGASPAPIHHAVPFDATGNSSPALIFGLDAPKFGLQRLDGLGGAHAAPRIAHRATDGSDSVLTASVVDDLDGDGTVELAIAIGEWHAFDLRIFHADASGTLELIARRRLGRIGALQTVRRGHRRLLAAAIDDAYPAPELFPEPPHTGAPAGTYLFEWTGEKLDEVDFAPLPRDGAVARFSIAGPGAVGDFDGDRRDDLALDLRGSRGRWTQLLRQTDDGFDALHVAGVRPWGALQLDDDPAAELLGTTSPDDLLVVLGTGGDALPDLRPPPVPERPPPPTVVDPLLVARWTRADDLVNLGLIDSAAASLREAAGLAADARAQRQLLDRAAELYASIGDDQASLALDRHVRAEPELAARARARSARALVRIGRYDEALAEATALAAAPGRTDEQTRLARSLRDELAPLVASGAVVDLRFDVPLASAWRLHRPGALRRDPTRAVLELALPAANGPAADLPIEWDGGPLSLDLDLELEQLEFGACVHIAVVDAADEAWMGVGMCSMGGGGRLRHVSQLKVGRAAWFEASARPITTALQPRRVLAHLAYFPARDVVESSLNDAEGVVRRTLTAVDPPRPGRQRLVIGTFKPDNTYGLALADLRRLELRGARVAAPAPAAVAASRPARCLAENDPHGALAALAGVDPRPSHDALVRLLAYDAAGDLAGLGTAAHAVLPYMNDPTWRTGLALVVRTRSLATAALRGAAGPSLLPHLARAWTHLYVLPDDLPVRRRALLALQDIERLAPTHEEERLALRQLLLSRGRMLARAGERALARRDLEAAAALPSTPGGDSVDMIAPYLALVHLLVREEPDVAYRYAAAALAISALPDESREQLLDDPAVAAATARPDWRALLRP